jgi:hypothetical protein
VLAVARRPLLGAVAMLVAVAVVVVLEAARWVRTARLLSDN